MRVVGLDIAKNVFQVHGVDRRGETVLRKRLRRSQVGDFFRQQIPCLIGIEATQGAHYWARVLRTFGHEVRLVAPQFVKPYLKSQKNDANDAEAICEAVSRPSMRFVPSKSIEQQDLQALHRIRSRMIGSRTQLGNQIRGLLAEYGIVLPLHLSQVRRSLPRLIEEDNPLLSGFGRQLLAPLYEELCTLEQRIAKVEEQVQQIHRGNALCQKIAAVEGVGPVTATARWWRQLRMGRPSTTAGSLRHGSDSSQDNIPVATSSAISESPSEAIRLRLSCLVGARYTTDLAPWINSMRKYDGSQRSSAS